MDQKHTVVVILEAQAGKEDELKVALEAVVEPSRAEPSCLEYRLHQDQDNPAQFMLYENWVSKEKHQEQFEKSYILALGAKLGSLLAKPYQVLFAKEVQ